MRENKTSVTADEQINKILIFTDTKRNTHSIAAADILYLIMRKKTEYSL